MVSVVKVNMWEVESLRDIYKFKGEFFKREPLDLKRQLSLGGRGGGAGSYTRRAIILQLSEPGQVQLFKYLGQETAISGGLRFMILAEKQQW